MVNKIPKLNKKGLPICEICGVGFNRVLMHANRRHGISASEYKERFGYSKRSGIQSTTLRNKMRKNALINYDRAIMENLIIGGRSTRFIDGNTATDKALVSKIASARMADYWNSKKETKQEMVVKLIKALSFS